MADMKNPKTNLHALLIPYPFQGHVNPTVHLAIKLASQGITVTFVNTHYNHHQITSKPINGSASAAIDDDIFAGVRSESGLDIRYATVSDGLPIGFDRSLNHDQYQASLLHVFSAHVEELVARLTGDGGEGVNVMIADTFFVWPSAIARKFGLVCVSFWTEAALVFSLYYHMDLLRINGHFGCLDSREDLIDYIPGVQAIEPKDTMSYLQETDISVVHQIIFKAFEDVKRVDFVLCNTIHEFELETIEALNSKIPFYSIGPIIPFGPQNGLVTTSLWSEFDCTQWLDAKPKGSVLYVSFGSYAHVTKKVLVEIAHGLLLSKVNFVWVVRPDIVSSEENNPLPDGFESEAGARGIVIPWCCQMTVLSHPAIGGFLTHCGWNSILESIWCEVPLICFPLLTDQVTNRKLVVDDWRIGINLCGNRNSVGREEVSRNIDSLMCGKSGEDGKEAIRRVRKSLEDALRPTGSSDRNLGFFIDELKAKAQKLNGPV